MFTTRRPRRRGAGIAAGVAALALVTTACSGGTSVSGSSSDNSKPNASGSGKVQGTIRLSYWGSGQRVELTNGVSKLFEKANSGVTVTPEYADFASYWQKLNVQSTSGNMACVAQMQGRQLNDYSSKGLLLDLEPMVKSGAIDVSKIPQSVLDTGKGTDGKLYEIPYGAAYDSIMINQTLAKQAGVGLPADGYTWDDFVAYLNKAKSGLPGGTKVINLGGGLPNYFIEYVRAQGEDMFKGSKTAFSEKTLVDFWNMWEKLRKGGVTTTAQAKAAEAPQTEQSFIATGKVMVDNKPGNQLGQAQGALSGVKAGQQLTTVALPGGSGGSGTVLFTSGFSIPKSCKNPATAAAYINFWVNNHDANKLFASNNGADTNADELKKQISDPSLDPSTKHMLQLYNKIVANKPPTVLYPAGYQANFETAFTRAYQEISLNGADVQKTAKSFIDQLNSALASAAQ
jgi:multiple sugar transport system substrate-binding protein